MAAIGEALGMALPHNAAIPAVDSRRQQLAEASGRQTIRAPFADAVTFVHVEIYKSNKGADLSPTVEAWALPSEPWFITVDGTGTITSRLDGAFGGDEMQANVEALTAA
jgi:hypothetical protein